MGAGKETGSLRGGAPVEGNALRLLERGGQVELTMLVDGCVGHTIPNSYLSQACLIRSGYANWLSSCWTDPYWDGAGNGR